MNVLLLPKEEIRLKSLTYEDEYISRVAAYSKSPYGVITGGTYVEADFLLCLSGTYVELLERTPCVKEYGIEDYIPILLSNTINNLLKKSKATVIYSTWKGERLKLL